MDYTSITPDQRAHMLRTIGVPDVAALFAAIPPIFRFSGPLNLPPGASELELQRRIGALSRQNKGADTMACFMGAGAYDHFVPAFIDQMISRGEFLTAYTPYQAEASQGMLQAFFEFQTQVARLTGLDISNASLYEGASAAAEAVGLAMNATGKRRVLVAGNIHPDTLWVVRTHLGDLPAELVLIQPGKNGLIDPADIAKAANDDTACVVIQSPNVFGLIEDWDACFKALQSKAAAGARPLNIAIFNPIACALLRNPGACGADIACGEGQPLGIPLQFGGPYLGLFAARKEFIRRMPGRLVGQTVDSSGRRAFALILQTREQHIRGAKATSNICTNQGLLALRGTMYMTAMGPNGVRSVAEQCWHKAHYLAAEIAKIKGYARKHQAEFFHEFVVTCPRSAKDIITAARKQHILPGVDLSTDRVSRIGATNELLITVTEKRTKEEMDALLNVLRSLS